mgnify:CR=1 FL=1
MERAMTESTYTAALNFISCFRRLLPQCGNNLAIYFRGHIIEFCYGERIKKRVWYEKESLEETWGGVKIVYNPEPILQKHA